MNVRIFQGVFGVFSAYFQVVFREFQDFSGCFQGVFPYALSGYALWTLSRVVTSELKNRGGPWQVRKDAPSAFGNPDGRALTSSMEAAQYLPKGCSRKMAPLFFFIFKGSFARRELSEFLSAYYLCRQSELTEFFAELTEFAPKLSEAQ